MISTQALADARAHALAEYPNEAVGFVVGRRMSACPT